MARPYDQTTKGFDVYKNGIFIGFVIGQSQVVAKETARQLVTSTHMGTWSRALVEKNEPVKLGLKRSTYQYEYSTTIGVYLLFLPCRRISSVLSNYRINGAE